VNELVKKAALYSSIAAYGQTICSYLAALILIASVGNK